VKATYGIAAVTSLPGIAARSSWVSCEKPATHGLSNSGVVFTHFLGMASKSSTDPDQGPPPRCVTAAASAATNLARAAADGSLGMSSSTVAPIGVWIRCVLWALASANTGLDPGLYGVVMYCPRMTDQSHRVQSDAEPLYAGQSSHAQIPSAAPGMSGAAGLLLLPPSSVLNATSDHAAPTLATTTCPTPTVPSDASANRAVPELCSTCAKLCSRHVGGSGAV
jgi:hypothetical protein